MSHKIPWLILLLLLALGLRLFNLGTAPRGLHADEVSFIINAQSLLQTGKDEDGRAWPWHLNSFIDPKPALYSYLQMPFQVLMGDTIASSRLPSVLLGVISIALLYYLVKVVFNEKIALLSAFLMTLSPWHNMVSRATQEVILAFVFLLLALISFQKLLATKDFLSRKNLLWWGLLILSSFLAMDTYHSHKIFLPLALGGWSLIHLVENPAQYRKYAVVLGILVAGVGLSLLGSGSTARFEAVGILSNAEPQLQLEEQIRQGTGQVPGLVLRLFYNKVTFYGLSFLDAYAQHFTIKFFFLEGGQPLRYRIPLHGLLFLIEILLIPLGLMRLFTDKKINKYRWLIIGMALLAPIPAALTFIETPSMIRSLPLLIPMTILAALGIESVWQERQSLKKAGLLLVILVGYVWGNTYFFQQLIVQDPVSKPWYRNEPYQKIAQEVKLIEGNYDRVVVTNDLRPLYGYFVREGLITYPTLQAHPLARNQEEYSLSKYTFNQRICSFGIPTKGTLYVTEIQCLTDKRKLLKTISYGDGFPVYGLWEDIFEPQVVAK